MPTKNQKRIAELEKELSALQAKYNRDITMMNQNVLELNSAGETLMANLAALREAVEDAGWDIFVDGEHKPAHTVEELNQLLSKYSAEKR